MSDAFEEKYMSDGAKVLHREKKVSRGMAGLLALPSLITIALAIFVPLVNASSSKPMPAAMVPWFVAGMVAMSAMFLVLAITFAVLRFVVTEAAVHVKYGLWGPTIPLEDIVSCRVVDYDWTKYGGWGIRRGVDGSWAYVATTGPVAEVQYREGAKTKKALLGAEDAHALVRAIEAARGGRVRIEATEASEASEAIEAIGATSEDARAEEIADNEPLEPAEARKRGAERP